MKKVLFLVASPYQMLNAIVLRLTERKDCQCDMLLRSAVAWDEKIIKNVEREGVFDRILRPDFTEAESKFWELSDEEKEIWVEDPIKFYGVPPIEPVYDEMFAALDAVAWKLIYYYQFLEGKKADIIQYDEGIRSYSIEYYISDNKPFYKGKYEKNSYSKSIKGIYLYNPDLYSVKNFDYKIFQLPNPKRDEEVREKIIQIYSKEELPKEKYIYFEDFFFVDRNISNDIELLKEVSSIVGIDNIIIKTHPRGKDNRFEPLGFRVMNDSKVPWEIRLLDKDVESKVLVSVSSTAIFSPYLIFGERFTIISLEKLLKWEVPLHKDMGFDDFIDKLFHQMNDEKVVFYMPESIEKLREILRYTNVLM